MGVVVPLAWLTVAVSVTGEFCVTVEAEACNVVEVLTTADFTVTETVPDEEALKLVAPEYAAVMELVPTGSVEIVIVAAPEASVADPSEVEPL